MHDTKRIIAIETSGRFGSVAAMLGDESGAKLLGQIALGGKQRTAQALAPALQRIQHDAGWSPRSVNLVAVAVGPGSFTGLRIGVTTAKTFAYAIGADVIAVNTLDALAAQSPRSASPLWTILDAQRQELFAAKYIADNPNGWRSIQPTVIVSQDAWLSELQPGDHVVGTALTRLAARLPTGIGVTRESLWQPMAFAVGEVAWQSYTAGQRDDLWQLVPQYYRPSAAEERLR